jgi:hypothetical protein
MPGSAQPQVAPRWLLPPGRERPPTPGSRGWVRATRARARLPSTPRGATSPGHGDSPRGRRHMTPPSCRRHRPAEPTRPRQNWKSGNRLPPPPGRGRSPAALPVQGRPEAGWEEVLEGWSWVRWLHSPAHRGPFAPDMPEATRCWGPRQSGVGQVKGRGWRRSRARAPSPPDARAWRLPRPAWRELPGSGSRGSRGCSRCRRRIGTPRSSHCQC